jgi:hypothetical protein
MLCIIQDETHHKESQIMKMDTIYREAYITIVGFEADDAMSSLPGSHKASKHLSINAVENVKLGKTPVRIELDLLTSNELTGSTRYETRGWTFQERIISRRSTLVYYSLPGLHGVLANGF